MFGKRHAEELQQILESAKQDRELYAAQAAQDRAMFMEQLTTAKSAGVPAVVKVIGADEDPAIRQGQELQAAYALNLCTVSISQIIDYNDLIIMEQEYDAILNNLNLENFPKDEALLKILKQILDVVAFFRIQAEEKKLQEEEYKKRVKDAVWSAVPSPSAILAGGSAGWVGLAVSAAMAVGTGYMNYRRERANIDMEQRRKDWELQRSAMEQFDGLRRELFDTAWRLADKYAFKDEYRLTARQISQYNQILEDTDPLRRYERLFYVKDNFVAYPPFWYYLGHAAAEVSTKKDRNGYLYYSDDVVESYKTKAIAAYQQFLAGVDDDAHRNLLREDQTCAACALELFALVAKDPAFPHEDKIKLLRKAAKNAGNAFDTLQICATSYLSIGEIESGLRLMNMLVNEGYNEDMNAQILAMMYVSSFCRGEAEKKNEYLMLASRVGDRIPLLPLPNDPNCNGYELSEQYIKQQCSHLLNDYRDTVCEYIMQCSCTFQNLLTKPGDISTDIIDFVSSIEQDMTVLFFARVAKRVRNAILSDLREALSKEQNRDVLNTPVKRIKNTEFTFEKIFTNAFLLVAEIIANRIRNILSAYDEDKMQKISDCTGQLLLFKQSKKIYSSVASTSLVKAEDDPYEILRKSSEDNEQLQKCSSTITRFVSDTENMLIIPEKKKVPSQFYTQKDSAAISDYMASKKNISTDISVIAVLDTNSRDLIFTPTGIIVPRKFHESKEVPYANIEVVKGSIRIGDIMFDHDDVDNSALARLINSLKLQTPNSINSTCIQSFQAELSKISF